MLAQKTHEIHSLKHNEVTFDSFIRSTHTEVVKGMALRWKAHHDNLLDTRKMFEGQI